MDIINTLYEKVQTQNIWEKEIILKRNEYLKVKGSTDTNLYYIQSGTLRIFIESEFEEQVIRLGYSSNFIAALDSFISERPSDLYIQAIKKCTLKRISKKTFMTFVENDPENYTLWFKILEQLMFQQLEREKDLLTVSPKDRYQRVLQRSPQLFQEIPNKYIASYLRMTPETLSRIKKSLI